MAAVVVAVVRVAAQAAAVEEDQAEAAAAQVVAAEAPVAVARAVQAVQVAAAAIPVAATPAQIVPAAAESVTAHRVPTAAAAGPDVVGDAAIAKIAAAAVIQIVATIAIQIALTARAPTPGGEIVRRTPIRGTLMMRTRAAQAITHRGVSTGTAIETTKGTAQTIEIANVLRIVIETPIAMAATIFGVIGVVPDLIGVEMAIETHGAAENLSGAARTITHARISHRITATTVTA